MSIYCTTTVTGETDSADEWEDREVFTYDVPNVHLNINEDDDKPRAYCTACNVNLDSDGNATDDSDQPGWLDAGECHENLLDEPSGDSDYGPHEPTPIPLSWINSVNIIAKEERDELAVTISVGDPRGAFVMRVERMRYTDDEGNEVDELRLSVPHSDDSTPHMTLTPLASPGYYRIG